MIFHFRVVAQIKTVDKMTLRKLGSQDKIQLGSFVRNIRRDFTSHGNSQKASGAQEAFSSASLETAIQAEAEQMS